MINRRILRFLGIFFGVLLMLMALGAVYLFSGASSAQTHLYYSISLPDPSHVSSSETSTVSVNLIIEPSPSPFLDLYLREPVQDGRERVTSFTAERAGRPIPHWQTLPVYPDVIRLWNGFSREPLTISYQVDPLWMKGSQSPRSYLGADFAYIRGMVTLYTTLSIDEIIQADFDDQGMESGFADAEVLLPQGWAMISPFGSEKIVTPVAGLRNAYFGFGPFAVQDLTLDGTPLLLGVYEGLPEERSVTLGRQVPVLFETMQKMVGFSPVSNSCYWSMTIVPVESIHGGASGMGSLVVDDRVNIIAHEMFHWWNGSTIATTPDANWLKEGFTTYYAAKSAYAAGVWTEEEFLEETEKFAYRLWENGIPRAVNLIDASNELVRKNNRDAYEAVYSGGAFLAYHLDRRLQAKGSSLDALWLDLYNLRKTVSSKDFMRVVEKAGGADLAGQVKDFLYGQSIEITQ